MKGKKIFFTPGPSQFFPSVRKHLLKALDSYIGSISHRSREFEEIYQATTLNLKKLLSIPKGYQVFYLSSATEAMERLIQNSVERHSYHLVNGEFASRFLEISKLLGNETSKLEASPGEGFNFDKISIDKKIELVCITQNETSTGVYLPVEKIEELLKKNSNSLVALDIVSSVPYPEINFSLFDLVFFSVQKGFGLPSGLAVLIASPRALEKSNYLEDRGVEVGTYRRFSSLSKYSQKNQTMETPNVLELYLFGEILKDFLKIGLKKIRQDTRLKSQALYQFAESGTKFSPFVKDKDFQSPTVIVLEVRGGSTNLIKKLEGKNLIVGAGYKDFKDKHIRIANFPAHALEDFKRLIKALAQFS